MSNTRKTSPARGTGQPSQARIAQLEREVAEPIDELKADAEADAQAEFEGVERALFVEFEGERFALARRVSTLPLMKFAHYAAKGTDSASMRGMAAMYEMLQSCFERGQPCGKCEICVGIDGLFEGNPYDCESRIGDEWPRFERHAIDAGADDEMLFTVVTDVITIVSARPTRRRSGYSPPERPTSARSREPSHLPPGADGLTSIDDLAR